MLSIFKRQIFPGNVGAYAKEDHSVQERVLAASSSGAAEQAPQVPTSRGVLRGTSAGCGGDVQDEVYKTVGS